MRFSVIASLRRFFSTKSISKLGKNWSKPFTGKSARNPTLDVVQQLVNAYFDRKFAIDLGWEFHPIATKIPNSNLTADFRKDFDGLKVQTEIQFGNMSRWYTDIFKFQAAYSESLTHAAVSVVPMYSLARRIDSNIVNFERAKRELPSANLSITLPILLVGVSIDEATPIIDVSKAGFSTFARHHGTREAQ